MSSAEKKVKDIMSPVEEYDRIDVDAPLCEALQHLRKYDAQVTSGAKKRCHKTLLVTDKAGMVIGKLSFYDFIKGLVPEPAKEVKHSRKFYSILSSRTLEVSEEIGEMQKQFKWLHSTFLDLVKQETQKKVKDVMSPLDRLLVENDSINKAIFIMFKENVRQPAVTKGDEVVGIVNLMTIFPELLEVAGNECFLNP
jgi:CBS domain-containing protein